MRVVSLPFIVSTGKQDVDAETRKFIRRHVMRGKNKGKGQKTGRKPQPTDEPKNIESSALLAEKALATTTAFKSGIPRPICSEAATIALPDMADPSLVMDLLTFHSMSARAIYQLYECIKIDAVGMQNTWLMPTLTDPALLNCSSLVVQSYFDNLLGRTRSAAELQKGHIRYANAVSTLQARIASEDDNIRLSEATILLVLTMLGHAYTSGDIETSERHNNGLLQLVSMRGIQSLLHNTRLCIELIRCDLYHAIDSGSTPILLTPSTILWDLPSFPDHANQKMGLKFFEKVHPELRAIWIAMCEFSIHINAAYHNPKTRITEEQFLQTMTSIMYRLVYSQFLPGSLDEAVRLGLIAFSSPVFLHWNRVELPDRRFTSKLRNSLVALDLTIADVEPQEMMWLLMVAAMSMAHEWDNREWVIPWLKTTFEACGISDWEQLKHSLTEVLWVELVYDEAGKAMFTTGSEWTDYECPPPPVQTI